MPIFVVIFGIVMLIWFIALAVGYRIVSRKNENKQPSYSEQHCIDAMKNVSEQMNESAKITAEIDKAFCNYIYEENK